MMPCGIFEHPFPDSVAAVLMTVRGDHFSYHDGYLRIPREEDIVESPIPLVWEGKSTRQTASVLKFYEGLALRVLQ